MAQKPKLDATTIKIVQRVLAMPPKSHEDMKLGRGQKKKKRAPKVRASSSKPQDV